LISYLSQARQIDFIEISKIRNQIIPQYQNDESDCLKSFKKFLTEKQYRFDIIPSTDKANIIAPYQMIEI